MLYDTRITQIRQSPAPPWGWIQTNQSRVYDVAMEASIIIALSLQEYELCCELAWTCKVRHLHGWDCYAVMYKLSGLSLLLATGTHKDLDSRHS